MKMIVLTGTTNIEHMKSDLDIDGFELNPEELLAIERGL
jgi:diketogulonate reductase-like aldo/keto reductase